MSSSATAGSTAARGVRWLRAQHCHSVTRLKRNTVVYTPAEAPAVRGRGRPRKYGTKYRVDALDRGLLTAAGRHRLGGRALAAGHHLARYLLAQRAAGVGDARDRRDGWPRALVPTSDRCRRSRPRRSSPAITAATRSSRPSRQANALGLDRYHGRTARGVRRWPLLICLAHSLLACWRWGRWPLPLPTLGWPWYRREDTVGQPRRRLLAALAQAGIFVPEGGLGHPLPKIMPVRPPGERAA